MDLLAVDLHMDHNPKGGYFVTKSRKRCFITTTVVITEESKGLQEIDCKYDIIPKLACSISSPLHGSCFDFSSLDGDVFIERFSFDVHC